MLRAIAGLARSAAKSPIGKRLRSGGGAGILAGSVPGAVATSVMSTVTTGNPLAGVAIGLTDLAGSSLLARGLGSRTLQKQAAKVAKDIPIAGRVAQALPGRYIGGNLAGRGQYMLSTPQAAATALGSIGAAITLEPYFYPKEEAAVLAEQYPAQMGARPEDQSQMLTQSQQLEQLKYLNNLQQEANTPGTMYQLQGMPTATLGAEGLIDPNMFR